MYLGLSMLELSKILMYEFWHDYLKPKYGKKKKKNCVIWTQIVKTDYIYIDFVEDVEARFDTSYYELEWNSIERPLPKGKNGKVIGLMIDELGGKIMTKFVELRGKTYSFLIDNGIENKKQKTQKNVS